MTSDLIGRVAAIMSDGSRSLTYDELHADSARLARRLLAAGLRKGDRVAIMLENCVEWFIAAWGARRVGLFFVPVNWHLTAAEAGYVLANSDARALITSQALAPLAVAASEGLADLNLRLAVGGATGFEDFDATLAGYDAEPLDLEPDGGSMPYSSGTTGRPKGVLRDLTGDTFGVPNSLEVMLRDNYGLDESSVYLSPAPLYHSAPVGWTGAVLATGGTIVVMPSFDAEGALAAIEKHRVTHAQFVPTHFVRLLRLPDDVRHRYDLSTLRIVVHGAAPCAPQVKRGMIDWLGPIVHEYYSGSERCGFTKIASDEWLAHPGSVGRSLGGRIHIVDLETGHELPPGEIGLVYFENPVPFLYHKDPEKTAATYSAQGWGTFGDVGHIDADGYLYLADRRSDLILSGGVNIYPQEVENVLIAHPAVADVGVIGVPNEEFGQEVKAIVQRAPDAEVSAAELVAFCSTSLARFKLPRTIEFTDALPRLPNGKLLRRELVERYRNSAFHQKEPA